MKKINVIAEELLKVSKEIKDLYDNIFLALANNNEEDLNKYLKLLKEKVSEEEELYQSVANNANKVNLLNRRISKNQKNSDFTLSVDPELDAIQSEDSDLLVNERIRKQLLHYLVQNEDSIFCSESDDFDARYFKLKTIIVEDYYKAILAFITLSIQDKNLNSIKMPLLKTLLNVLFIHRKDEKKFLEKGFPSLTSFSFDYPLMAEYYNVSKDDCEDVANLVGDVFFDEFFSGIIEIDNNEFKEIEPFFSYIMATIFVRASFLFMKKDYIGYIKNSIKLVNYNPKAKVEGESYEELLKRARQRMDDVFAKVDEDRKLPERSSIDIRNKSKRNINLNYEDYVFLEKLFVISKKIKDTYENLSKLELTLDKESPEYKKEYQKLQILLQEEHDLYESVEEDLEAVSGMIYYIKDFEGYDPADVLNYLKNNLEDEILKVRVITKLENIMQNGYYEDEEELTEEDKEAIYTEDLICTLIKDFVNTILRFLNDYIYDERMNSIRNYLLDFKYRCAYAFTDIEEELIANNFNINPNLIWESHLYMGLKHGDLKSLEDYQDAIGRGVIFKELKYLIKLYYLDMKDNKIYGNAVITEILIRASLLFIDNETLEAFLDALKEDREDTIRGISNPLTDSFVQNILMHQEEDKKVPVYLEYKL